MVAQEIGSEFHWLSIQPNERFLRWPQPHRWSATARESMVAVSQPRPDCTLFVPDYFCQEVVQSWADSGLSIKYYLDHPQRHDPVWDTLRPEPGDMVLAVNYFGLRSGVGWSTWHQHYQDVLLVEDHSHDPFSQWCMTSQADFAFASIRKIYPVPDGALLWSPRGHNLPPPPSIENWSGSALKLAAMILKRDYLVSARDDLKETYRRFQVEGETQLMMHCDADISPWSHALIEKGFPMSWRTTRQENANSFNQLIAYIPGIEPLLREWYADEQCPFNGVIVFESKTRRDHVRAGLIAERIYPVIHWDLGNSDASPDSIDLSRRILTIPIDQRYGRTDLQRCAAKLRNLVNAC